jgi:uncharacterized protein (TIGR02145 family)
MNKQTNIRTLLILALVVLLGSNQNIAQNVGIGAESFTPDPSAVLELKSTELNPKGFLPPRMTTAVRDAIQNPAEGLQIFNTTTKCVEVFAYGIWQQMFCAVCPVLNAPTAGTHTPSETEIVWNWNASAGADGYKWHTTNNYAAAADLGNVTTVTQIGLTCNTSYTIYVWAYNACGNSTVLTLTQTTSVCPFTCGTSTVTFTYNGSPVTYGTVTSSGKCWLDRNLGASQVATSSTDGASYGDLFQWGRAADGHQNRNSGTISSPSNTDQPGHASFITNSSNPWDWRSDNNNNRWNANPIVNNPCPSGWRVPTEAEWNAERTSWTGENPAAGAFASPLKLPLAGGRNNSPGSLYNVGLRGDYWSSSVDGSNSSRLHFSSESAAMISSGRVYGFSVRCIKD